MRQKLRRITTNTTPCKSTFRAPFPYSVLERFWSKVNKDGDCWIWKASKRNKGYGAFVWVDENGKTIQGRAHRFSWEIHRGKIPNGMCCLHTCDNPACVNPNHLWLGSKKENNQDMVRKNRHISGGSHCGVSGKWKNGRDHWNYKFNKEKIKLVIADRKTGMSFSELSKKHNICQSYLWRIVNFLARKDVLERILE